MEHDFAGNIYTLLGAGLTVIGTVVVAVIGTRRGNRAYHDTAKFKPQESGEHAHTRDIVRDEAARNRDLINDRFNRLELAEGLIRQSDQVGISAKRLAERKAERKGE